MVSVVPLHSPDQRGELLDSIGQDLAQADREVLVRALEFAEPLYAGHTLSTGEAVWPHALGLAVSLAAIGMDAPSRASGILFAAPKYLAKPDELREKFGAEIASLAAGVEKLYQLRVSTRPGRGGKPSDDEQEKQSEVLRKMVLAMVEDIRVVLIRLASRTQTLRFFAKNPNAERESYAQESLDIYAPLANRLARRRRRRREDRVAAAVAGVARRGGGFGGVGGAVQAGGAGRHGVRDDAAGPGD